MDSMFESTRYVFDSLSGNFESNLSFRRQRQKLADEDAPPTASVFDLPNEAPHEKTLPSHFQLRVSPF
jgi:hypothetical protein